MDEQILEALRSLGQTLAALPSTLSELLQAVIPLTIPVPQKRERDVLFGLQFKELTVQAVELARGFERLGDVISVLKAPVQTLQAKIVPAGEPKERLPIKVMLPKLVIPAATLALPNLSKVLKSLVSTIKPQIQLPGTQPSKQLPAPAQGQNTGNGLQSGSSMVAFGFKAVITPESLNALKGVATNLGTVAANLLSGVKRTLGGLPAAFGGFLARTVGGVGKAIAAPALGIGIPWGAMKLEEQFENLRRQALAANALNSGLGQFSGVAFSANMRFQLGQYQRMRTFAHQTEESAATLADRVNAMENAFLPFDILRRDIANKIGTVKANLAGSFAKNILTPIANLYSFVGESIRSGLSSDSLLTKIGTLAGTILPGVVGGALLGSRFGLVGTAIGGIAGGLGTALGVLPDTTSRILGEAGTFGAAGSLLGLVLGGLGGFFLGGPGGALAGGKLGTLAGGGLGAAVGAVKAAVWDEDENDKIKKGPWMDFINTARNERPLRPPLKAPFIPNRFQRIR